MESVNGVPNAAVEIKYARSHMAVVHSQDRQRLLIITTPLQERFVFELDPEAAERIGKALSAPSVIQP